MKKHIKKATDKDEKEGDRTISIMGVSSYFIIFNQMKFDAKILRKTTRLYL